NKSHYNFLLNINIIMNEVLLILLILFLLILVIIGFSYIYSKKKNKFEIYNGVFREFNLGVCKFFGTCLGNNPLSPYARSLFFKFTYDIRFSSREELKTDIIAKYAGAVKLSPKDAMLVYGKIPRNYTYWSLQPYLFDKPNRNNLMEPNIQGNRIMIAGSIGEGISSAKIESKNEDENLLLILTPNSNLVEIIKTEFMKMWAGGKLQIHIVVIPEEMYDPENRYAIWGRWVFSKSTQTISKFKTQFWHYKNPIEFKRGTLVSLSPTKSTFNERSIISLQEWEKYAQELVQTKYKIVHKGLTTPAISGYRNGYECSINNSNCLGDNPDATY